MNKCSVLTFKETSTSDFVLENPNTGLETSLIELWWGDIINRGEKIGVEEEMELWEKIRARSLGTCDRWSSWISCPSLCDWSCCGHFVCSNSTMEVGWERNLCFPRRFGSKITSQCCPMWGDLSWWQIEMLIKDRVERGVKSANHYYHTVCRGCKTGEDVGSLLRPSTEPFLWACSKKKTSHRWRPDQKVSRPSR